MWSTPFSPTVFDSVWFPICSLQTLLESAWVLCSLYQPCCMPFPTIIMRSTGSANFWWSSMSTPRLRLRNLSANSKNSMKNTLLQRSPLLLSKFLWQFSSCFLMLVVLLCGSLYDGQIHHSSDSSSTEPEGLAQGGGRLYRLLSPSHTNDVSSRKEGLSWW